MAAEQPAIIVQQPAPGIGLQIVVGALAGVLAWWLVETITSMRAADDETEAE
jgi:hypothetical protein